MGVGVLGSVRDRALEERQRLVGAPVCQSTTPSVNGASGSAGSSVMAVRSACSASAKPSCCFSAMPEVVEALGARRVPAHQFLQGRDGTREVAPLQVRHAEVEARHRVIRVGRQEALEQGLGFGRLATLHEHQRQRVARIAGSRVERDRLAQRRRPRPRGRPALLAQEAELQVDGRERRTIARRALERRQGAGRSPLLFQDEAEIVAGFGM